VIKVQTVRLKIRLNKVPQALPSSRVSHDSPVRYESF